MQTKISTLNNFDSSRLNLLIRALVILIPLYFGLIYFGWVNIHIIISISAIVIVYAFFRQYVWVLALIAMPAIALGQIIFYEIKPGWIYEMSLSEVLVIFSAIIVFLYIFLDGKLEKIKIDAVTALLFAYFLLSLYSLIWADDFRAFIAGIKIITLSFLSYFIATNLIKSKKRLELFIISLAGLGLVLALQTFYKFYQMGFSSRFFSDRSSITIPVGAIALSSAILAFLLPIIFSYCLKKTDNSRFIFWGIFILGFLAVGLSMGKAAIISLGLGLGYLFIKHKKNRIVLILILMYLFLIAFVFFGQYLEGLYDRMSRIITDPNTRFRITELRIDWKIITNYFWFGVGAGQQPLLYKKLIHPDYAQLVNNVFVQAFIDLGVIGFSLAVGLAGLIFSKIRNWLKQPGEKDLIILGLTAGLIAAFFNGLAEVTFFALPYAIVFWMTLGAFFSSREEETINS